MREIIADNLRSGIQMKINEIYVDGFKNIKQCRIHLDGISAVVAPNNFGKSNLLEAIEVGIEAIRQDPQERLKTMSTMRYTPRNRNYSIEQFTFEICGICIDKGKEFEVQYSYSWQWKMKDVLPKVLKEELRIKEVKKSSRFRSILQRDGLIALIRKTDTGRCDRRVKINNSELVLNKLAAWDDYSYWSIVGQVIAVEAFYEHQFNLENPYNPPFFMMKDQQDYIELSTADEDMGKTLWYLKEEYPIEYNRVVDAFCLLLPEILSIKVVENEVNMHPDIKEAINETSSFIAAETQFNVFFIGENFDFPLSIDYLSDGTKRVLLLLTMVLLANIRGLSLVEIEEAENHIHPKLLASFLDIIETLRGDCNVLFSSHSPYMTKYIAANQLYVGVCEGNCVAEFRRISDKGSKCIYKLAEQQGVSASELIFDYLCGDSDDRNTLLEWTEE